MANQAEFPKLEGYGREDAEEVECKDETKYSQLFTY